MIGCSQLRRHWCFFKKCDPPPLQVVVQGNGILLRWIGTGNAWLSAFLIIIEMDWDGLVLLMHDCPHSYLLLTIPSGITLTAIQAMQNIILWLKAFESFIVAPVPESPDTSPSKAGSKGIKMNTRNVSPALWACNSHSIMELLLGYFVV